MIVPANMPVLLNSGFSGAINTLKVSGKLNIKPITNPCTDQ